MLNNVKKICYWSFYWLVHNLKHTRFELWNSVFLMQNVQGLVQIISRGFINRGKINTVLQCLTSFLQHHPLTFIMSLTTCKSYRINFFYILSMFMQKFHQMLLIIKAKGKVFSYNHRFLPVYIVYRMFLFLYLFAQNKCGFFQVFIKNQW